MATIERLKRRPDFLAAAEGRRFHTERMTAQGCLRDANGVPGLRLGFTVTKRVGHAPERNRIRRRLREAARRVATDLPADLARLPADIVLIARRPALDAAFDALAEDLRRAIPAVTRPRDPARDPQGRQSKGRQSKGKPGRGRSRPAAPPPEPSHPEAAAGPASARDRGPASQRLPGAPRSDRTDPAPGATSNACGGVPDGQ